MTYRDIRNIAISTIVTLGILSMLGQTSLSEKPVKFKTLEVESLTVTGLINATEVPLLVGTVIANNTMSDSVVTGSIAIPDYATAKKAWEKSGSTDIGDWATSIGNQTLLKLGIDEDGALIVMIAKSNKVNKGKIVLAFDKLGKPIVNAEPSN